MLCLLSVGLFNVSISTDAECRKQQCGLQITDVLLANEVSAVLLGLSAGRLSRRYRRLISGLFGFFKAGNYYICLLLIFRIFFRLTPCVN